MSSSGRVQKGTRSLGFPPVRATKASASRAAFISAELKDRAPAILELPEEVLCRILSHLPHVYDVLACGQVCKEWFKALQSDVLWQGLYSKTWGPEEAGKAASSVLAAAESIRESSTFRTTGARTGANDSGASEPVKRPEVNNLESRDASLQSPPKITSNRGSVSGLARGLGRLALSPRAQTGRGGPKDKPDEKKVHEPCAWREAYASRFKAEKRKFLTSEIKFAEGLGLLKRRRGLDGRGGRVLDPAPGMARLVERLQLRFEIRINNGRAIPLRERHAYHSFPTSLSLKCPPSALGQGLTVQKLLKVELTAVSERLYSSTRLFQLDYTSVRNSTLVAKSDPLSLYEASLYPDSAAEAGSLVIGTFGPGSNSAVQARAPRRLSQPEKQGLERSENPGVLHKSRASSWDSGMTSTADSDDSMTSAGRESPESDEEVVLLVLNVPFVDILWKVMVLGLGAGPRTNHRVRPHDLDRQYGLHDYHASAQIRSFGKLLWCQDFYRCFHSKRESVPGEKAVFVLLPTEGGMPALFQGVPKLAWRTEAFSGELHGALVLDFAFWDQNDEVAWHCSKVVTARPLQSSPSPEFGHPYLEGEHLHAAVEDAARGICLSLDLRVALKDPDKRAGSDILPQSAITGLRLSLTSRFLTDWFGMSHI